MKQAISRAVTNRKGAVKMRPKARAKNLPKARAKNLPNHLPGERHLQGGAAPSRRSGLNIVQFLK
jgi:hypothetical protein